MDDSQRPKPLLPFEIPDLEIAPPPSVGAGVQATRGGGIDPFEPEVSQSALSLDLDLEPVRPVQAAAFGSVLDWDDAPEFELVASAAPPRENSETPLLDQLHLVQSGRAAWPTGRALDPKRLEIDPTEVRELANYGPSPATVRQTPGYAYRVFKRQRELKQELVAIGNEGARAESEREATLAKLAHQMRPVVDQSRFRAQLTALRELEAAAEQQSQQWSRLRLEYDREQAALETQLAPLRSQIESELTREREALRANLACETACRRSAAEEPRVHIELRALAARSRRRTAELGSQSRDPEPTRALIEARQQASAAVHDASQAALATSQAALGQVRAQLDRARQEERRVAQQQRLLAQRYEQRNRGREQELASAEKSQHAALAELGRALLADGALGGVPEVLLDGVRVASERADQLLVRRELQRRALESYDVVRVSQGVRLSCTLLALLLLLVGFKLVF